MAEKRASDGQEHIDVVPNHTTKDDVEETIADAKNNIDTKHQDEAMKVLANYNGDLHWAPEEEKVIVRKIDKRLLPILILTYGLQYYDKAMISQAVGRVCRTSRTVGFDSGTGHLRSARRPRPQYR